MNLSSIPWLGLYTGGIALFWVGAAVKTQRGRHETRWQLKPTAPVDVALPPLRVLIPARDEAANIGACVRSVAAGDHPAVRVTVFDDGSSDGTGPLAAEAGAEVRSGSGGPLPEGWKGKPWALQRASFGPDGAGPCTIDEDWILFLDADVRVAPEALSRAHAYAIREGLDFLTGFGRLTMVGFWENVIQPSVGGLILSGNDLGKVNDPKRAEDLIANGQFILVRRSAYEAVGGHAAVKADILDDVGLARAFFAGGFKTRCVFMRELFSCRMYTTFSELWLGWTKNLYAGLHHRPLTVLFVCGFLVVDLLSPYVMVPLGLAWGRMDVAAAGLGLVALIHAVRAFMDGVFGQDRRYGVLQPLGTIILIGMLLDSLRRSRTGAVVWKGRTYAVRREDDTLRRLPEAPVNGAGGR